MTNPPAQQTTDLANGPNPSAAATRGKGTPAVGRGVRRLALTDEAWLEIYPDRWVLSWSRGHKVIHNIDSLYELLAQAVHDEQVRAFQVGFSRGAGTGYGIGFHDAERMLAR